MLRSAAGYHAFRRVHPRGYFLEDVVGFLLLRWRLPALRQPLHRRGRPACCMSCASAMACAAATGRWNGWMRSAWPWTSAPPAGVLRAGLHEFVDWIQRQIIDINETLAADFFGNRGQLQQEAEAQ